MIIYFLKIQLLRIGYNFDFGFTNKGRQSVVKKLRALLTRRDKQFLLFLLFFSVFISLLETVGISIIMPFISVASDFSLVQNNEYYKMVYDFFGFGEAQHFVIGFGVFLIGFYVFRSGVNLFYFHLLARFSQGRYHLLAYRLFESYLGMSYRNFIDRNSSNLTKTIVNEAGNLTALMSGVLMMFSEVFVVIFIYAMMLYMNWKITLLISILLFVNALFLVKVVSLKIKQAGKEREGHQKKFYEIINSSMGNFKLMKLKSNASDLIDEFGEASYGFAKANILNQTLIQFPRLFLEALGFCIVTFVVIYLVYKYESNVSAVLGLISMFVLGLYRLMPSANRILSGYNQILFHYKSLDIVHQDIMYDRERFDDKSVAFADKIELQNIDFAYKEDKPILNNIQLTIAKGSKIAFVGESGSGKSTLVDIIIGLYRPINGKILIDGQELNETNIKAWRKKIGYIPQSVYLFDGSVAQNVAFGSEYDEKKVTKVCKLANILEFLNTHQEGIRTMVGENGIKLSGGQKQRIAIARALYDDPEILVLDEATSALDNETESIIMDEIYKVSEDKTLIIIAHRLSTIERCERVFSLKNNTLESNQ